MIQNLQILNGSNSVEIPTSIIASIGGEPFLFGEKMEEVWKSISGYEGLYEISNYGKVKSLERTSPMPRNGILQTRRRRELILKPNIDKDGYLSYCLYKNGGIKRLRANKLVWINFKGVIENGLLVDHVNDIKSDNHLDNLQLLNNRENVSKGLRKTKSLPIGVGYKDGRYVARITTKGKTKFLGSSLDVGAAEKLYLDALADL